MPGCEVRQNTHREPNLLVLQYNCTRESTKGCGDIGHEYFGDARSFEALGGAYVHVDTY
jgi:hypothetical protein